MIDAALYDDVDPGPGVEVEYELAIIEHYHFDGVTGERFQQKLLFLADERVEKAEDR